MAGSSRAPVCNPTDARKISCAGTASPADVALRFDLRCADGWCADRILIVGLQFHYDGQKLRCVDFQSGSVLRPAC